MINKIILTLDGSKLAEKALPYAEILTKKFAAELFLIGVVQPSTIVTNYPEIANQIIEDEITTTKVYLKTIQDHLSKRHLRVSTAVLYAPSAADAIIAFACQEAANLIVMSTHGRSGLSRWVHGSVASKVLQHAPCPVLLVRASEADC